MCPLFYREFQKRLSCHLWVCWWDKGEMRAWTLKHFLTVFFSFFFLLKYLKPSYNCYMRRRTLKAINVCKHVSFSFLLCHFVTTYFFKHWKKSFKRLWKSMHYSIKLIRFSQNVDDNDLYFKHNLATILPIYVINAFASHWIRKH